MMSRRCLTRRRREVTLSDIDDFFSVLSCRPVPSNQQESRQDQTSKLDHKKVKKNPKSLLECTLETIKSDVRLVVWYNRLLPRVLAQLVSRYIRETVTQVCFQPMCICCSAMGRGTLDCPMCRRLRLKCELTCIARAQ